MDKGRRLFDALRGSDWELAEQLICPETSNYQYPDGISVLQLAVMQCAPTQTCSLLLQAKANPNIHDRDLNTPLHMAFDCSVRSIELHKLLLEARASVNAQNWVGYTPLMNCAEEGGTLEQLQLLLNWGANPSLQLYPLWCETARQLAVNNPINGGEVADYLHRIEMQFGCCKRAQTAFVGIFRKRRRSSLSHDMVRMVATMIWATRMDDRWRL
jgi:hypothetical protein